MGTAVGVRQRGGGVAIDSPRPRPGTFQTPDCPIGAGPSLCPLIGRAGIPIHGLNGNPAPGFVTWR